jgi:hypothetical protein
MESSGPVTIVVFFGMVARFGLDKEQNGGNR